MPEPDPQTPQPSPIPFWKWLLPLAPTVIVIASVFCISLYENRNRHGSGSDLLIGILAMAGVLCVVLGFFFEKWGHGQKTSVIRGFACGLLILGVNFFLLFAGCLHLINH
jgi:4-amino-4-deoxy-L-arabinose transferase-like glycosyltransferase